MKKCKDCTDYGCLHRGDGDMECFYEAELQESKELEEKVYWQSFRAEATKDILCAVLPRLEIIDGDFQQSIENAISNSIYVADEIIKKLKEK